MTELANTPPVARGTVPGPRPGADDAADLLVSLPPSDETPPVPLAVAGGPAPAVVRRSPFRRFVRSRGTGWTLVVLVVIVWQVSSFIHFEPTISSPDRIARTWWREITEGQLLPQLGRTLETMAIGFVLAIPIGITIGFLMGRSRIVWGLLEPSVEIIRLTPVSAILPIFILFLGIEQEMQVAVFLTAGLFPLIINSYAGARSVSKVLSQTAQTYRLSWWQTQREVALPSAMPYILVGARQALGISLVLAVVIGMLAGNSGIGYYILLAQQEFNINRLLAAVLTVALIGYLLNALFLLAERRISRWRRTSIGEG
ncbi:ABC transporter permease [Nakamurella leprariae]|uniref:ABC transporter permease n=1 Tax=Nakamurella leprariae TaxID=2803911 RepID=A0A938YKS4_9ACTN|nr:ABC transporter permease [Nakamurella leprariae]MBM9469595.1 ABC transporter permease [Nakamurella leprariae]